MSNPKRIKSKRKHKRLERNRMIRRPDSWEDPPEDEPEEAPADAPEPDYEDIAWGPAKNAPHVDRDCDYWNRVT